MKPLKQGEEEIFTVPVRSRYGNGTIIVTNFGLAIHTQKTGAILDLLYKEILGVDDLGKGKMIIRWMEPHGESGNLQIDTKVADGVCERILEVKEGFDESAPKDPEAPSGPIGSAIPSKERAQCVPTDVPDEFVWHDCWYDAVRRLYITQNPYFVQNKDLRKRHHQIEYQDQTGDRIGIVAKKEKTRMIAGCPSVQIGKDGKRFYMLLPSLTREMITAEIAAARHAPATNQPRIDYFLKE